MSFDEEDRASVADADAEETWDIEIRRRAEELESGSVEPIPWSEVRQRLFRGFELR